jgi:hypothetical protein
MIQYTAPVKLCNLCFFDRGLKATVLNNMVVLPDTMPPADVQAVLDFLPVAPPCPHVNVTPDQKAASDEWATINARLNALPAPADPDPYAALRARLTSELTTALAKANELGGIA